MVLPRTLLLLCVAAAIALADVQPVSASVAHQTKDSRSSFEQLHAFSTSHHHAKKHEHDAAEPEHKKKKHHHHHHHHAKKTEGEVEEAPKHHTSEVKLRIKKHQSEPSKKVEETTEDGEVVRTYDHGSVRISAKDTTKEDTTAESKKHQHKKKKHHHHHRGHHGKKAESTTTTVAADQDEVTSTAAQVTDLASKLSSTSTSTENKGLFTTEYGPVVFICGVIGALAAVIGVVALVATPREASEPTDIHSVLDADIDVEANVTAPEAEEDAPADRIDALSDSESEADEEAEGSFANGKSVSV